MVLTGLAPSQSVCLVFSHMPLSLPLDTQCCPPKDQIFDRLLTSLCDLSQILPLAGLQIPVYKVGALDQKVLPILMLLEP